MEKKCIVKGVLLICNVLNIILSKWMIVWIMMLMSINIVND